MFRTSVLTLAVAISAACGASAQAQTTLRYQFKQGDKLPYVMEQKMKMAMSVMGMDIETKMNMNMEMSLNVVELTKDGAAKISFKVSGAKMTMDAPTGNVEVDSNDKNEPNDPIGKILSPMVSVSTMEMTGIMLPTGEMKDVKVSEATLKALKNLPGADKIGDILNPDSFKSMLSNLVFPAGAVAKGKTWNNKVETKTQFGKTITENTYTFEGAIQKDSATLQKISVAPKVKIDVDPNAPVKIAFKDAKGSGQILFDNKTGRIVESTTQQTMQMEVSANGMDIGINVNQTTTLRLKKK